MSSTKSIYRPIHVSMWTDSRFTELSDLAKLLYVFLATGPNTLNLPGLSKVGLSTLVDDLAWRKRDVLRRFAELESAGLAKADWSNRLVWLPEISRANPPDNPNVAQKFGSTLQFLAECDLKTEATVFFRDQLLARGSKFLEQFDRTAPQPFPERFPKRLGESENREQRTETVTENREQKIEQKREQKTEIGKEIATRIEGYNGRNVRLSPDQIKRLLQAQGLGSEVDLTNFLNLCDNDPYVRKLANRPNEQLTEISQRIRDALFHGHSI
jgi:hypothetical protein